MTPVRRSSRSVVLLPTRFFFIVRTSLTAMQDKKYLLLNYLQTTRLINDVGNISGQVVL